MCKNQQSAGLFKVMLQRTPDQEPEENPQVSVFSPAGHYLYELPEPEARELLKHRLADRAGDDSITLHEFSLPRWMQGTKYTYRERIPPQKHWPRDARLKTDQRTGKTTGEYAPYHNDRPSTVHTLIPIPTAARPVFLAVLTSCTPHQPQRPRTPARAQSTRRSRKAAA